MNKRLLVMMMVVLLVGSTTAAFAQIPSDRTPQTLNLLASLKRIAAEGRFMFGHHDDTVYGKEWSDAENRSDVEDVCGDRPAIVSFDLGRLELGDGRTLDGVEIGRLRREIIKQYMSGGMVTLSWHCYNPLSGRNAWVDDAHRPLEQHTIEAILADGGAVNARFLTWLDFVADFLNSLKAPDGKLVPILFRPWHEHTGSWFWWGQNLCNTEQYKALWQLTVNRLTMRGVRNALYAYSTGLEANGDSEKFMERYPGDEYIDLIGMDFYCSTSEPEDLAAQHYIEKAARNVPMLCRVAKEHGKAVAITETGYEGLKTNDWWTKTLLPAVAPFQFSYLLVWRNSYDKPGHYYAPYPGHPSIPDFKKFYKDKRTIFLRDAKGLY